MNIIAYTYSYPPYRHVGSELTTADYLEHLAAVGYNVHVYSEHVQSGYVRNGVYVHAWSTVDWGSFNSNLWDVFITHPELRFKVWPHVQGIPYIALVHNARSETLLSLQRVEPDLVIANSHETAMHVKPLLTPIDMAAARVYVLHPPLLAQQNPPGYVPEYTRSAYTAVGLSVDKGGDTFLNIAEQNPDLSFRAVKGGYGMQLTNFVPPNVHVLPHTTPEHMNYVYSRARAVLVPSRSESYCKVVAEALFQGVPVIASNLPAIREVGGDYITYVDADDEDAWGDRVREMEDPRRHTMMADLAYQRGQHLARETIDTLEAWAQAVACIHIPKG